MSRSEELRWEGAAREELPRWIVALSQGGGLIATAVIFALLAWSGSRPSEDVPIFVHDVTSVALPELPPPPPVEVEPVQPEVAINPLLLFAEERTETAVRLPSVPIAPEFVPEAAGRIDFDFALTALKPAISPVGLEARHVFDRSEVDELPRPVVKKRPRIADAAAKKLKVHAVRFLFVVSAEGGIEQIRVVSSTGDPAVDALCVEALSAWKFTPAVRKGVKVRCWAEQGFNIRPARRSPFES